MGFNGESGVLISYLAATRVQGRLLGVIESSLFSFLAEVNKQIFSNKRESMEKR